MRIEKKETSILDELIGSSSVNPGSFLKSVLQFDVIKLYIKLFNEFNLYNLLNKHIETF